MPVTEIRKLNRKDSNRIKCSAGGIGTHNPRCRRKATHVEYREGLGTISFHYFCDKHVSKITPKGDN